MVDESALLDLLECPVCLERLDASAKVLPCQHTFCKRCLLGIVGSRNELRCPECRTLVGSGVEQLPSNILLVRLLDGIKQRPWKPGPVGGSGTNCNSALRAQSSAVVTCSPKDGSSSQGGPQPRAQAWSPPVRVSSPRRLDNDATVGRISVSSGLARSLSLGPPKSGFIPNPLEPR